MPSQKNAEATKGFKLRTILNEFNTVPWHGGLDQLDYTLSVGELVSLANEMRDGLNNFEFKPGDCVIKVGNPQKKGTVVQINAATISSDPEIISSEVGEVIILWDDDNNKFESRNEKMMSSNWESISSKELIKVLSFR